MISVEKVELIQVSLLFMTSEDAIQIQQEKLQSSILEDVEMNLVADVFLTASA